MGSGAQSCEEVGPGRAEGQRRKEGVGKRPGRCLAVVVVVAVAVVVAVVAVVVVVVVAVVAVVVIIIITRLIIQILLLYSRNKTSNAKVLTILLARMTIKKK